MPYGDDTSSSENVNQFKVALKTHLFTDYYFDTVITVNQLTIPTFILIILISIYIFNTVYSFVPM